MEKKTYKISFNQIYLSKPMVTEADGYTTTLFPKEARLRNLTYSAPLYVDMVKEVTTVQPDGETTVEKEILNKNFIGKVPIMLRSDYCSLHGHTDKELTELGECPYDEGGYFVINGSEKVLIAQERMSTNHVYVFEKKQPSKFMWQAECRSQPERGSRGASSCVMRLRTRLVRFDVRYRTFERIFPSSSCSALSASSQTRISWSTSCTISRTMK